MVYDDRRCRNTDHSKRTYNMSVLSFYLFYSNFVFSAFIVIYKKGKTRTGRPEKGKRTRQECRSESREILVDNKRLERRRVIGALANE